MAICRSAGNRAISIPQSDGFPSPRAAGSLFSSESERFLRGTALARTLGADTDSIQLTPDA
jgi:hypothetical protein